MLPAWLRASPMRCSGDARRLSARHAPGMAARFAVAALGRLGFNGEADLDRHLVMRDLAALDMTAGVGDFEPADIVDGRGRARDRGLDRILDAGRRGADELNDFVDVVGHGPAPSLVRRGDNG